MAAARCVSARLSGARQCLAVNAPRRHLFTSLRRQDESKSNKSVAPPLESKAPVDDYYALLLEQPLVVSAVSDRPILAQTDTTSSSSSQSTPPANQKQTLEKGRIIFGSKLAGPAMRQRYIEDLPSLEAAGKGTYISGMWIPPKPTEPDNCCMSGCVNCVWDGYREELEEWVRRKRSAQDMARMNAVKYVGKDDAVEEEKREGDVQDAIMRGEDDGMGTAAADWELNNAMDEIPVGIREFMKTEKRLQMARRESAAAAT